jgi:MoxR-like ATPase
MMKVTVDYPDFVAEKNVLELRSSKIDNLKAVISTDNILEMQEEVEKIYIDEKIKDLIVRVVHATRPGTKFFMNENDGIIMAGASPRASIWLYKLGKFMAYMAGKDFVSPDDVIKVVPDVLAHRVILTYEALVDKISARDIVTKVAKQMV